MTQGTQTRVGNNLEGVGWGRRQEGCSNGRDMGKPMADSFCLIETGILL